jgi:hypothetical protein
MPRTLPGKVLISISSFNGAIYPKGQKKHTMARDDEVSSITIQ